ncbi:conjugal transfer protein [Yersinia kristensenii]|nr:conjugal transfer protein [Yersinia kristensenii]
MKLNIVKSTVVLLPLLFVGLSSLPAIAADPCEVVICMYGKVTGNSPSECNSAEGQFFSINAFKKKGRFDPTKTADMRKSLLGSCPMADPSKISEIISKFGRIRG